MNSNLANKQVWDGLGAAAVHRAEQAAPFAKAAVMELYDMPPGVTVWHEAWDCRVYVCGDREKTAFVADCLRPLAVHDYYSQVDQGVARPLEMNAASPWILVKSSAPLAPVATLAGWRPGLWPMAPNPMTATLGSSLLGAGLGYGTGWLAEQLLPEEYFEKGKLRRLGAAAGGVAGAVPALWASYRGWFNPNKPKPEAFAPPAEGEKITMGSALAGHPVLEPFARDLQDLVKRGAFPVQPLYDPSGGLEGTAGTAGVMGTPIIPTDAFNQAIWNDPYTPGPVQAAASGVVQGASAMRGNAPYVSPMDIVHVGLGMGSGLVSGMLVGKVLGALAGLKPQAQKTLQQVGMWGGLMKAVVPMLFGGS